MPFLSLGPNTLGVCYSLIFILFRTGTQRCLWPGFDHAEEDRVLGDSRATRWKKPGFLNDNVEQRLSPTQTAHHGTVSCKNM